MNQEQPGRHEGYRLTTADIERKIKEVVFFVLPDSTVTICHMVLQNGFSVRGESACVDARFFDRETGERLARAKALDRVWELEGYLLAESRHREAEDWKREEAQMG